MEFIKGQSVSITIAFNAEYDYNNIEDIVVVINNDTVAKLSDDTLLTTANPRAFRVQLSSNDTLGLREISFIQVFLDDSVLGVRPFEQQQIRALQQLKFSNSSVNTGSDFTLNLTIEEGSESIAVDTVTIYNALTQVQVDDIEDFSITASTAATTATTQAGIATTQAGISTTKASEASTSASNASTSASTATTQASNASTSASSSSTSATNAATSASTATTQATNASNSATAAAASATSAANSATNVANNASLFVKRIVKDVVDSASVTGTVSETILASYLIPANSFSTNDYMKIINRFYKSGSSGTATVRVRLNTTNSVSGSALISIYTSSLTASFQMTTDKSYKISDGNLTGSTFVSSVATDTGNNSINITPFNPAIDNYIIITAQLADSASLIRQVFNLITN